MLVETKHIREYEAWLDRSQYSTNVRRHYLYYFRKLVGRDITQSFIDNQCSSITHMVYRSFLKGVLECFNISDISIPKIRGRHEQKEVIYYTDNEMQYILDHTKDAKIYLIIKLMYENGMRISEVLNIRRKDIDMINRRIRGVGKGNKWFNMNIYENTYNILKEYIQPYDKEAYVFRWDRIKHQRQKALWEIKRHLKELFPNKDEHHIFCHAFRHTCGTHLMQEGWNLREIQDYLRHSKLDTVAAYTAVDKAKLEAKATKIFS